MTKRICLKVVHRTEAEDSGSLRDSLLGILQQGLNAGTPYPDLIHDIRSYIDTKTIRYRELLIERIKGSKPQPLSEALARAELLDMLEPMKDGDILELKETEHNRLVAIMSEYNIQPNWDIIRFHQDVERADDALPQVSDKSLRGQDLEFLDAPQRNGHVLHAVGAE